MNKPTATNNTATSLYKKLAGRVCANFAPNTAPPANTRASHTPSCKFTCPCAKFPSVATTDTGI